MKETRLPQNGKEGLLYGSIICLITVIVMLMLNIGTAFGGLTKDAFLVIVKMLPVIWIVAMLVESLIVGRIATQTLQTRQNRLGTGESLSLRFTKNVDRDLSVTLLSVGAEENGRCVVTFQGNTYLQELTLLRRQSAEIILDTTDGLRVPLAALRVATQTVTEKDPETEETASKEVNVTGVYCVSGAKARFKPVEVLLTGDDFAVVRSAGSTEKLRLRPGDEIIVAARDLYDGKVVS